MEEWGAEDDWHCSASERTEQKLGSKPGHFRDHRVPGEFGSFCICSSKAANPITSQRVQDSQENFMFSFCPSDPAVIEALLLCLSSPQS